MSNRPIIKKVFSNKYRWVIVMCWGAEKNHSCVIDKADVWFDTEIEASKAGAEGLKKPRDVIDNSYLFVMIEKQSTDTIENRRAYDKNYSYN